MKQIKNDNSRDQLDEGYIDFFFLLSMFRDPLDIALMTICTTFLNYLKRDKICIWHCFLVDKVSDRYASPDTGRPPTCLPDN